MINYYKIISETEENEVKKDRGFGLKDFPSIHFLLFLIPIPNSSFFFFNSYFSFPFFSDYPPVTRRSPHAASQPSDLKRSTFEKLAWWVPKLLTSVRVSGTHWPIAYWFLGVFLFVFFFVLVFHHFYRTVIHLTYNNSFSVFSFGVEAWRRGYIWRVLYSIAICIKNFM